MIFLDSALAMDRSPGQAVMHDDPAQEAEQRLAVAALHKVAGERNFRILLPKMYLDLWDTLVKVSVAARIHVKAKACNASCIQDCLRIQASTTRFCRSRNLL